MIRPLRNRRWAVFISGRGSNLQALLDLGADVDIRCVLSSRSGAPGLARARRQGIPATVLPKKIDWAAVDAELRERGITHLFLAGFMRLIPADFVRRWKDRILNVHPSLLPDHAGLGAIEASYEAGSGMGVTVHVVTPEMDAGPRLLRKCVHRGRAEANPVSLEEGRILISRAEQRLVREAVARWR